jgi:hypothetical protein
MSKMLTYPGNYTPLIVLQDYMRNYEEYFIEDYNAIDDTSETITEVIKVMTEALNGLYDELPRLSCCISPC